MELLDLARMDDGVEFEADLVIVGGGPAGLTVARELFNSRISVLVLESGHLEETASVGALNTVEVEDSTWSQEQINRRMTYHGANAGPSWSHDEQRYGVRCRVLGGASHAWLGKSAAFQEVDFEHRPWVPGSGWPIGLPELSPYLDRAAVHLNLGPNAYGDDLWSHIGIAPPKPELDGERLQPFFWQFARSRMNPIDLMRFGPEFVRQQAPNVRVLLNATAVQINTNTNGTRFESVDVACLEGRRIRVRAAVAVLAASAIENARLLMISRGSSPNGLGNKHGNVGRYLMDHPGATIARFDKQAASAIVDRFGFYGARHAGRMHMYMHGLALPRKLQERERLLNCALYMMEERAPDDPIEALKRLLKRTSPKMLADLTSMAKSPGLLFKGLGMKLLESGSTPEWLKTAVVDTVLRFNPRLAVRERLSRGVPHKLLGVTIEGICEQRPDPDNRVLLSEIPDALGVPHPRVRWHVDPVSLRSMAQLGKLMAAEFARVGLPKPHLEDWVMDDDSAPPAVIDMAHTLGTTRMCNDPRKGVVDPNCRVHDVDGLYVAGGSVFATSGHANPTLMILGLAVRMADHIKQVMASQASGGMPPRFVQVKSAAP